MSRILFVDDEETLLAVLEPYFEADGHEVEVAATVEGASAQIAGAPFDAVVADLRLGPLGQEGLALLSDVRRLHPAARTVLLTGSVDDHIQEAAQAAGIDAILLKPQPLAALRRALEAMLAC